MDAGLPNAYQLTRRVYESLIDARSNDATLYAVVVAKLIARNAKNGKSPFEEINVEDVYDGLKRLLNRNSDLLSEFVSGWDPISTASIKPFDGVSFGRNLSSAFKISRRRSLNGDFHLEVDNWRLKDAITELERGFGGEFAQYRNASLGPFLDTLSKILRVDTSKMSYMDDFLLRNSDRLECIATLNYDQLIEVSQENRGEKVDLGLSSWNEKRFVRFHGQSLKLVKLHGSTDWYIQNHDEIIIDRENKGFSRSRAMIFGGQGDKLVPYGPFLHLRHQFQQFLQSSSYLLVVGYSFQDLHLNALIRSWIATRRSGKIIIVDPNPGQFSSDIFQYAYQRDSRGNPKGRRVEIKQIKEKFSNSLGEIQEELEKSPNLSL